ncbi:MAG: nucleotidyltransferase family protein [Tissierellia bacterium]|nr:nucleotidyltransferase family protein [Tissierellia bacterium]
MKIITVLAEYNPFHKGHLYHLEKIRELHNPDYIIVLMSGSFTQRGEPAIQSKWLRATNAINCGADIVFEFPCSLSTLPATDYANTAVNIFDSMNVVTHMSFGVSDISIDKLNHWKQEMEKPELSHELSSYISKGTSFPKALEEYFLDKGVLSDNDKSLWRKPNNILSIQYLHALDKSINMIEHLPIKRNEEFSSASSIRTQVLKGKYNSIEDNLPHLMLSSLQSEPTFTLENYKKMFNIISYMTIMDRLIIPPYYEKGLNNRLISSLKASDNWHQLAMTMKTKRYPLTRISRFILHQILQYEKEIYLKAIKASWPLKLLAGSKTTAPSLMKEISANSNAEIVTNWSDSKRLDPQLISFEQRSTDLYETLLHRTMRKNSDATHHFLLTE